MPVVYDFTPTETVETRLGIHFELGEIPLGETAELWVDEFKIEDMTILGVNTPKIEDVKIYPNPTVDHLFIKVKNKVNNVIIYDIRGIKVLNSQQLNLDVSSLSKGLYIVEIETVNQKERKVFIKH